MNLELISFICKGVEVIPDFFFQINIKRTCQRFPIAESNREFPFVLCLIVTVVPPGLKRCTESKPW